MRKIYVIISTLCAVVLLANPLYAIAESVGDPVPVAVAPLIITEVQTGSSASASEEFIELYNNTNQTIDLNAHTWRLEIASSTATNWTSPYRSVLLDGTIAPGQTYIVASEYRSGEQMVHYLPSMASVWFTTGLSANAGHVRLMHETYTTVDDSCRLMPTVVDQMEWTGSSSGLPTNVSLDGRNLYVEATAKGISSRYSLQRVLGLVGYSDTDNDQADFATVTPTPGAAWQRPVDIQPQLYVPSLPTDACDPNPPVSEPSNEPSEPPEITTPPPIGGSDDPNPSETPDEEPVPGDITGLLSPQISELLPNPAAPRTDAADEYVELYNPNTEQFVLDGYVLEAGETTKRRYIFPVGTVLPPQSYVAYYVTQTGLSLSNETGRVRLLDSSGVVVSTTDQYSAAPDDKAWAYVAGVWGWTTTATPNAPNVLTVAAGTAVAKKTSAATTPKKSTTAVKATTTAKATKTTAAKTTSQKQPATTLTASTADARRPIHVGILAAIGVFAVLYGAYEYRHDLANKFHQLRSYRAIRRKARPDA